MHSLFPGFNTLLEGVFWDLFELRRRGHFDQIDVRKMGSFQNKYNLWERKKSQGPDWENMGVFQSCNVPLWEKLTNINGCVSRSVIGMERPFVGVVDLQGQ